MSKYKKYFIKAIQSYFPNTSEEIMAEVETNY